MKSTNEIGKAAGKSPAHNLHFFIFQGWQATAFYSLQSAPIFLAQGGRPPLTFRPSGSDAARVGKTP